MDLTVNIWPVLVATVVYFVLALTVAGAILGAWPPA
jgi:hypothetical protein